MLFKNRTVVARQAGAMDAQSLSSWVRQHAAASLLAFQAG
jgi:transposase-like protein